ncbi:hypothetical protein BDP55DRAFT_665371 [Colletotrichum godetiae]|uniref:Uncharacterized protein n=1 Tax=Colletotrichum godetiae TaxID=1209918 RepID=A0AAJ0AKE0_9PEZI|nr:uncharacterized protein BDP55DRAFT_665371 [Colletotrichum godetiae]KAK1674924.1 hypothetical protein BDP55DRAFT_665371 [Colletotrichum godetiae]
MSRKAPARRSATRYAFWSVSESVSWPPTTCLVCVDMSRDKEGKDGMEKSKSQSRKTIVIKLLHLLSAAAGVCLVIIGKKKLHRCVNHLYPLGDLRHIAQHPTACQMRRHCRSQHEKNPHMSKGLLDPSLECSVPPSTTNRDTQGNGGRSNSICIQATREEFAEAGRVSRKERRGGSSSNPCFHNTRLPVILGQDPSSLGKGVPRLCHARHNDPSNGRIPRYPWLRGSRS